MTDPKNLASRRELEHQLNLCHQRAAALLKQSRIGDQERNEAAMRRIKDQLKQNAHEVKGDSR